MKDLIKLPGVARKTANVVLWGGFGINEGLAVDTHVKRISGRLGLTKHTDPVDIEKEMKKSFLDYSMSVIVSRSNCSRNPNGARSTTGWSGSAAMSVMRGSPCATNARWLRFAPK